MTMLTLVYHHYKKAKREDAVSLPGFQVGKGDEYLVLAEQSDEYGEIDEAESHFFNRASELKL